MVKKMNLILKNGGSRPCRALAFVFKRAFWAFVFVALCTALLFSQSAEVLPDSAPKVINEESLSESLQSDFTDTSDTAGNVSSKLETQIKKAQNRTHVFDDAGLFTESETARLESMLSDFVQNNAAELAVVTTVDARGKTARAYADDFYDEYEFGIDDESRGNLGAKSGALLLIDMDNRECYISTAGSLIDYLTDARIESILDEVYPFLSSGEYGECAVRFVSAVESFMRRGIPSGQRRVNTDPTAPHVRTYTPAKAAAAAAIGAVFGLIACLSVAGAYRFKKPTYTYPFRKNGTLVLDDKSDTLIRTNVTKRHIDRSSASGASTSSVHTSSSGTTHGGGGRKF